MITVTNLDFLFFWHSLWREKQTTPYGDPIHIHPSVTQHQWLNCLFGFIKFSPRDLYKKFSKLQFCEHWFSDSHALFKGMDNILLVFTTSDLQFVGGEGAEDFHKEELSDFEFHEIQHSKKQHLTDRHTCKSISILTFHKRTTHNAVRNL
jgi:hypothetical protein